MSKTEDAQKSDEQEEFQPELLRLQRQYRLLEDDRRAYKEETEYILKKQQYSIKNLNAEHEELLKETKLSGNLKNLKEDQNNISKLRDLLEEESKVKEDLQNHSRKLRYFNKKLSNSNMTADTFRKNMGGPQASESRCKQMIKLRRVIENRLNEGNVKFNKALAENSMLREEINHINGQRKRFAELQNKLSKIALAGKDEKNELIEKSTHLFNNRDESHHRMHSLRERSERDMNSFNFELKDLLRVIDHDNKLREFMRTKMEERQETYEMTVNGRKEKKLLDYVKGLQAEVEHYESIFNELHEVSGITDVSEMVYKFIKTEDENFSLFNFVKDLSQQIQQKETSTENLNQQIQKIQNEDVRVGEQQKEILSRLEETEHKQKEENQKLSSQIKTVERILVTICVRINEMLDRLQCNRSSMTEQLSGSMISANNVISYLGLVEQRAFELIQAKMLLQIRKGEGQAAPEHTNPFSFATVGKIVKYLVGLPSLTSEVPDTSALLEMVRPISQDEARTLINNINRNWFHRNAKPHPLNDDNSTPHN